MWFYNLGSANWQKANAITRALAVLGREGVVLTRPQPPALCVGDKVNVDCLVDMGYCRNHDISIVKSPSRTNALCLAQVQLELRIVLPRRRFPLDEQDPGTFPIVLLPLLASCRELGIGAEYKSPNELVVRGRRIAAACLGQMSQSNIFSATLAVQFDADSFAELLKVSDEALHTRLIELVHARRTSVQEELTTLPPCDLLEQKVLAHLRQTFPGLQEGVIDRALQEKMKESPTELPPRQMRGANGTANDWDVDVGAGTELQQRTCRAPGGFLRATCEWHNSRIVNAMLAGDFLCYPPGYLQRLESALVGVSVGQVAAKVCDFYREFGWVTPGIQPGHWTKVLLPLSLENYTPALSA